MKTRLLTTGLLASTLCLAAHAQTTAQTLEPPTRPRIQVDDQSVVTDTKGGPVPAIVWHQMLATGDYTLKAAPAFSAEHPVFVVTPRTPAEREQYLARLAPPHESPFFTTGQALTPFKLRDVNGHKYDSKELAGKIVVLNFWFIRCGPCRMEIPELNKLVKQYAGRPDVVFLAVALDDRAAIQEFVQQRPYDYALVPEGRYVAQKYGVTSFPTNVVVDRQGKVIFHAQYHPNMLAYLQKAIEEAK
ncbi:TlpA family protein disulfide reductase [Hymenobacter crusticola]|nr:TlpA disulfide reductase family protein [Hymenobacter crusticola]